MDCGVILESQGKEPIRCTAAAAAPAKKARPEPKKAPREKTPDPNRAPLKIRCTAAKGSISFQGLPQMGGDFVLCRTCGVCPALRSVSAGVCCTSCEDLACRLLAGRPNAHGPMCTWGIVPKSIWRLTKSHEAIPPPDKW